MRIAILADPIDNQHAGIHVYTKEMTDALIRTNPGHEIIIIREKKDFDLKGAEQIAVWNTRLPLGFASLRLFLLVPYLLRKKKVDAVIEPAHFGPFNLNKKIKRITIIHDLTPILFPRLHRWHSQLLQNLFLKRILNKADVIISNSENTTKDICRTYPKNCNKVKRIYPGISSIFKYTPDENVLVKYGIQKPYFLFIGTIEPRKNLEVLLEAFKIFSEKNPHTYSLVIAGGTGWKSNAFYEALNKHSFKKDIHCIGFADTVDLPALYSQTTAFIYPSLYEGFGLPIAEALSCGAPVIAAENSALTESGGSFASYFATKDAEQLAGEMRNIILASSNQRKETAGLSEHLKQFNWDNYANTFWKILTG